MRVLLQKTGDAKTAKERMHLDLEADNVESEVTRLEALGATRWDHQRERGYDFATSPPCSGRPRRYTSMRPPPEPEAARGMCIRRAPAT